MVLLRGLIRSCCPPVRYLLLTGWSNCPAGLGCTGTPVYLSAQVSPQAEMQTNDAQSGGDKWTVPRGARGASCWLLIFLHLPGISENLRKCKEGAPGGEYRCTYTSKWYGGRCSGSPVLMCSTRAGTAGLIQVLELALAKWLQNLCSITSIAQLWAMADNGKRHSSGCTQTQGWYKYHPNYQVPLRQSVYVKPRKSSFFTSFPSEHTGHKFEY